MEDWKSGIKFHFYTKRDMKFGCKDSCNSIFFCTIRIRKKEIENTKHRQPFQKAFKFLYQYKLKERVCDKQAAVCSFFRGAGVSKHFSQSCIAT